MFAKSVDLKTAFLMYVNFVFVVFSERESAFLE